MAQATTSNSAWKKAQNPRLTDAKLLQSCPTLCDPHRRQPTRLPCPWDSLGKNTEVGCHFLLQCMKGKVKVKSLSHVWLLATPWTAAYQAPPSMRFSRWEYWSGLPLPSPILKWNDSKYAKLCIIEYWSSKVFYKVNHTFKWKAFMKISTLF